MTKSLAIHWNSPEKYSLSYLTDCESLEAQKIWNIRFGSLLCQVYFKPCQGPSQWMNGWNVLPTQLHWNKLGSIPLPGKSLFYFYNGNRTPIKTILYQNTQKIFTMETSFHHSNIRCGSSISGLRHIILKSYTYYSIGFLVIPACISDFTHYELWDEITYPFLNFNGCTVEI